MRAFLLTAFLALSSPLPALAANTPPGFEAARWEKLWRLVAFVGEQMDVGDGRQLRHFKSIVPEDKSAPHKAEYFSTLGVIDQLGKYHAMEISAVSEDWRKRENGDWEIEQWIYGVRLNGELRAVRHQLLVEKADGTVLEIKDLPAGPVDSLEELARWGAKLDEWYQRSP